MAGRVTMIFRVMTHQAGISFIEILVSLFLLSLFLLGLDAMALTGWREAQAAYYVTVANQQLHNLTERLQVNHQVTEEVARWNVQNQAVLPRGKGSVSGISPARVATISWGKENNSTCQKNKIGTSGCLRVTL